MPEDRTGVSRLSTVLLWLFVINLGIALGAGLYESRIVVPDWIDTAASSPVWNADVAREDNTGVRFWVAVTTVPLTLLTLANLVAGWRAPIGLRRWWLGTAATGLVERAFTLGYFVPTMVGLIRAGSSPDAVSSATQWAQLNNLRHLLVLAAWLGALRTFSLLYERRGRAEG
jgi:putative copper export protein